MTNLRQRPFALIGVNSNGHAAHELKELMDQEELNWRSFADQGEISAAWSAPAAPSYYIIDHAGVIRHKWVGSPGDETMGAALEQLIEEAERAATPPD